jgi:hypothetical protein
LKLNFQGDVRLGSHSWGQDKTLINPFTINSDCGKIQIEKGKKKNNVYS